PARARDGTDVSGPPRGPSGSPGVLPVHRGVEHHARPRPRAAPRQLPPRADAHDGLGPDKHRLVPLRAGTQTNRPAPPARGVPRDQVEPHPPPRPPRPADLPGVRGALPRPRRRNRAPGATPHRTLPLLREPDRAYRYLVDPAEPAHPGSVRRERGLPGSPPARGAAPAEPALAPECRHHFGIGHLREVLVPPADRAELPARDNGDELIHGRLRPPVGGRDGSGEDDPVGSAGAGDLARGDRARAG